MAESHWTFGRRVIVEDTRQNDTFMRITWHDESNVFVVSHWRGEVCVAATRVPVDAAPDLINLFVRGLAESSAVASAPTPNGPDRRSMLERVRRFVSRYTTRAA